MSVTSKKKKATNAAVAITNEDFTTLKQELNSLSKKWSYLLAGRVQADKNIPGIYRENMTDKKIYRIFFGYSKDRYINHMVYLAGVKMKKDLQQEFASIKQSVSATV
jgi:hypothetical protein